MVYFDFDGVICDLVGGFLNYLWFEKRLAFSHQDVVEYNIPRALAKQYMKDTLPPNDESEALLATELAECFERFLHDADALANTCDPIRDIWQVVRRLSFTGEVSICTARTGIALAAAHAWSDIWGLGCGFTAPPGGYKKLDLLKTENDVLVEDSGAVATHFANHPQAGRLLLVCQPWNVYEREQLIDGAMHRSGKLEFVDPEECKYVVRAIARCSRG